MLSIVIPTFSEKPDIEQLLLDIDKALANIVDYEVILIDNRNNDASAHHANPPQDDPRIRRLHSEKKPGSLPQWSKASPSPKERYLQ